MKTIFLLIFIFPLIHANRNIFAEDNSVENILKGDKYLISGEIEKAGEVFEEILKKFPTWWLVHLRMTVISKIMNNPIEQINEYLKKTIKFAKNHPLVWFIAGIIYEEKGELIEAEKAFLKAKSMGWNNERVSLSLGRIYWKMGMLEKSEKAYIDVIKHYPLCRVARWKLYNLYTTKGQFDKAIKILNELKKLSAFPQRIEKEINKIMKNKEGQ